MAAWWAKAGEDFQVASLVAPHGLFDAAAYHCQQAGEKWLKALLVALNEAPPHTHDLEEVLHRCDAVRAAWAKA